MLARGVLLLVTALSGACSFTPGALAGVDSGSPIDAAVADVTGSACPVSQVVANGNHTCARTRDGAVYCWGSGAEGQLGSGVRKRALDPTPVTGSETLRFKKVYAIENGTCALSTQDAVFCWGGAPGGGVVPTPLQAPRAFPGRGAREVAVPGPCTGPPVARPSEPACELTLTVVPSSIARAPASSGCISSFTAGRDSSARVELIVRSLAGEISASG